MGITKLAKERRIEFVVGLKQAGLSTQTILQQANKRSEEEGWGVVSRQTVEKDIADYFRRNRALSATDYDHLEQLREAHISQMEGAIEKLSIFLNEKEVGKDGKKRKKKWKAFEYPDAVEKLFKMQDRLAEIRNWNYGKMNVNLTLNNNTFNHIHNQGRIDLLNTKKEAIKPLVEQFEKILDQLPEEEEIPEVEVIDGKTGERVDIKDIRPT